MYCQMYLLISVLACDITQCRVVMPYRIFDTAYIFRLQRQTFVTQAGTDRFSRNDDTALPLYTALYPRRVQISSTSRRKPEIMEVYQRGRDSSVGIATRYGLDGQGI